MGDFDADFGGGPGASDAEDDDIARFERQCAARARAEGLLRSGEAGSDEDEEEEEEERTRRVRIADAVSTASPRGAGSADEDWRQRLAAMQEKLARRDAELAQARSDLDLLRSDGGGPGDLNAELKSRLLELTKKNRRLQVTVESQKTRLQQLEVEVKKPKEEARRQAEELALQNNNNAMLGDGLEDWKRKYLASSNKLQEVRQEVQELRAHVQRQKKVLLKELGNEEAVEKALAVADDPAAASWKGRAAQVAQLQRQVRDLKEQLKRPGGAGGGEDSDPSAAEAPAETLQRPAKAKADAVPERERMALQQAADKRREEFERLQEEVEKLRMDQVESKKKREAMKSRCNLLEAQLRELKGHVQLLLRKSDDDDALVAALRRQLGRHGTPDVEGDDLELGTSAAVEELAQENAELRAQLERQAQIVLQLRQKSIAAAVEGGSAKLGPRSVEASTSERQLIERVRYLEAENARWSEQVRLLRERHGDDPGGTGRPFSSESMLFRQERVRQEEQRLTREQHAYRQRVQEPRHDSSPSCRSSRSSSRGPGIAAFGSGLVPGVAS